MLRVVFFDVCVVNKLEQLPEVFANVSQMRGDYCGLSKGTVARTTQLIQQMTEVVETLLLLL